MYHTRDYRSFFKGQGLEFYEVIIKETDLMIGTPVRLYDEALAEINSIRTILENYIQSNPIFLKSLKPLYESDNSPTIIKRMCSAARAAGVGPMAAVAGAVSDAVGNQLLKFCDEVIIENGGDIFIKTMNTRKVGVFAGSSVLSNKISIVIEPEMTPVGICTSSGTVGHSLSFGLADAVVVVSKDTCLADAAATAICNRVSKPSDIEGALKFAESIKGVDGVLVIIGDVIAVQGEVMLAKG